MAIPKRGSRRIVVDGVAYRWKVRHEPADSNLSQHLWAGVALESGGPVLQVDFGGPRPDWNNGEYVRLPDGSSYTRILVGSPKKVEEAFRWRWSLISEPKSAEVWILFAPLCLKIVGGGNDDLLCGR
ncbi:MAG: hypothetical protein NTX57_19820 [Armatimonadetes bacterium]|nr:hypothetical protein [Armatimonadota bacterium]